MTPARDHKTRIETEAGMSRAVCSCKWAGTWWRDVLEATSSARAHVDLVSKGQRGGVAFTAVVALAILAAVGAMAALVLDVQRRDAAALPAAVAPTPARKPNAAYHCQMYMQAKRSDPEVAARYLRGLRDLYGAGYWPCAGQDDQLVALMESELPTPTPSPDERDARGGR